MKIQLLARTRLFVFFLANLFLFACQDDENPVAPDPITPETVEYKLESQQVATFQTIENGEETPLDEDKLAAHFGKRVEAFVPIEIISNVDSITFIKKGLIEEKFKTKWEEGNKLYLYNDHDESWTFIGEKNGSTFILKAAFFARRISNNERTRFLLGQSYGESTYDALIPSQEEYNLIWLQIEASYTNNF